MELEGANRNGNIPVEFERRKGYSLVPYIPFILKKVGQMGNPFEEEYGAKFTKDEKEGGSGMCDKYVASGAVRADKKQ